MLTCTNCFRIYSDNAVVNIKSLPKDFTANDWTNSTQRKNKYMFLYGPDEPDFSAGKGPCEASVSLSPLTKKRTCSLIDLQVYVPHQAQVQMPVHTVTMPVPTLVPVTYTNPAHIKPTWHFPNPLPTFTEPISYGDGECKICRKSNQHTLTESARSRWVAITIHSYLGVLAVASNPGFMIGVVIKEEDGVICVAYSSNSSTNNAQSNLEGCKFPGYKLKLYGNEGFADISKSRGGQDIRKHKDLSMVNVGSTGSRSSETCAASKLAKYLTKGVPLSKWNMTEIAFGTMAGYTDGVAAESCIGCQKFLPTLLCHVSG